MSIFRPINSDESNLFTIRCVIDFTQDPSGIIAGGSSITVATDLLRTPTANNLPTYFSIFYTSSVFYVHYGKEFTSCPSISIQPRLITAATLSTTAVGDAPIPAIFWNNITNFGKMNPIVANTNSNYNFAFSFKASDSTLITPSATTTLHGFDLIITGPVKLGVTTGNSNKGWGVGSGNDATSAYTFMNVGVGTGNPTSALQVQGRLDYFIYKAETPTTGPTTTVTLSAAQILSEVLDCNPAAATALTTLTAAEIIAALLSVKSHIAAVGDAFNLTINNVATTAANIITLTGGSGITMSGNPLIHPRDDTSDAVSIGNSTFRFIITNITSASEAVTIVRL
jgi:hypothetical protein